MSILDKNILTKKNVSEIINKIYNAKTNNKAKEFIIKTKGNLLKTKLYKITRYNKCIKNNYFKRISRRKY